MILSYEVLCFVTWSWKVGKRYVKKGNFTVPLMLVNIMLTMKNSSRDNKSVYFSNVYRNNVFIGYK